MEGRIAVVVGEVEAGHGDCGAWLGCSVSAATPIDGSSCISDADSRMGLCEEMQN